MLSFDDFVKVFDAYSKYVSKAQPAPQAPQVPPAQPAPQAPQVPPAPQTPQVPQAPQVPPAPQVQQAQDTITQMLTQMQSQLNQMQTPAPTINNVKPVSVDDVIAKIFD